MWSIARCTDRQRSAPLLRRSAARTSQASESSLQAGDTLPSIRPLAEELLFGQLVKGGHAFVSVGADEQLKIETRSSEEPALLE